MVPSIWQSKGGNGLNGSPQETRSVVYEQYGLDILPVERGPQQLCNGAPFMAIKWWEHSQWGATKWEVCWGLGCDTVKWLWHDIHHWKEGKTANPILWIPQIQHDFFFPMLWLDAQEVALKEGVLNMVLVWQQLSWLAHYSQFSGPKTGVPALAPSNVLSSGKFLHLQIPSRCLLITYLLDSLNSSSFKF